MNLLVFAQLLGASLAATDSAPPRPAGALALRHATVIDLASERALPAQTIVIKGRKIVSVGPDSAAKIPPRSQVIDATGRFVIAGLWDMHVHVPELVIPGDTALSTRLGWAYMSRLLLANGVTGVRVAAGNLKRLSGFRAEVERDVMAGPHMLLTGQKVGEQPVVQGAPFPIATEDDARTSVQLLKRRGADFVKVSSALPAPLWRAVADQSRIEHLQLVGHVPTTISLLEASSLGLSSAEHLFNLPRETSEDDNLPSQQKLTTVISRKTGRVLSWLRIVDHPPDPIDVAIATHDTAKSRVKFTALRDHNTWVTPTLALTTSMLQEHDRVAAASRQRYHLDGMNGPRLVDVRSIKPRLHSAQALAFNFALVRELRDAGVGILAGTDTPALDAPGFALHDELQLLVRAGLSTAAALRSATSDVGRFLHADSIGVIRAGATADLVVLDEDPLQDISATRRIATVISAGHVYNRRSLDRMLDAAALIVERLPSHAAPARSASSAAATGRTAEPR